MRDLTRYQKHRPGELPHLGTTKLARIPVRGGHRHLGRTPAVIAVHRREKAGCEFPHVTMDNASSVAYVEVHPDEKGATTTGFLSRAQAHFAAQGATVEAILTDPAFCHTASADVKKSLADLAIRHKTTRPYRRQTNGNAKRFIPTLLAE